jgi:hypothetical protein
MSPHRAVKEVTMLRPIVLALALVAAPAAQAASFGFELTIGGTANGPNFTITNLSDTAQITGGGITIGDTAYNFDCVQGLVAPAGGSLTFVTPEVNVCFPGGGQRPDTIVFTTLGFDPGETLSFGTDIDPDLRDASVGDFNILLLGGSIAIDFDRGQSLGADFRPRGQSQTYTVTSQSAPVVPLPAAGWLLLGGVAGLIGLGRRRTA